ncbi:MAG: PLP-dependent lyase/thiolase [bacterium]|nr:PLP-dependent lyase/thiolase [bacterium]
MVNLKQQNYTTNHDKNQDMTTPLIKVEKLAKAMGQNIDIFFKREDVHPLGSHKGRSIPLMIEAHLQKNKSTNFVISSSGNAALAAGLYIKKINEQRADKIKLEIIVGEKINEEKFSNLEKNFGNDENITINKVSHPKKTALQKEKTGNVIWLRQSTDEKALLGYEELAVELTDIPNLQAVFVPTSTGTTAVGLHLGFKKMSLRPQIHIIQTTTCHPFVAMDPSLEELKSVAGAIVDKIGHRKLQVTNILDESQGKGWIATNEEILNAVKLVEETEDLKISTNSALSVVGLKKDLTAGVEFTGSVVCLITGK